MVPARNWVKWGYAYAAHAFTGLISGGGIGLAMATGDPVWALSYLVTVTVMVRQTVEYLRRHDTPGRDIGDHLIGLVAGIGIAFVATEVV